MSNQHENDAFQGSWDYVHGENFDAFLKELGFNKVIRTIAKTVKPRLVINKKDGKWSFRSESTFRTTTIEFSPGVEFIDTSPDGREYQVTIRFEDGKWLQTAHQKNGKDVVIERSINDQDQMEVKLQCGNTKATELFKRRI